MQEKFRNLILKSLSSAFDIIPKDRLREIPTLSFYLLERYQKHLKKTSESGFETVCILMRWSHQKCRWFQSKLFSFEKNNWYINKFFSKITLILKNIEINIYRNDSLWIIIKLISSWKHLFYLFMFNSFPSLPASKHLFINI